MAAFPPPGFRRWRLAWELALDWWAMPRRLRRHSLAQLLERLDADAGTLSPSRDGDGAALRESVTLLLHRLHLPLPRGCMPRSLALYHALRRRGAPVQIVFGIRPGERIEEGHAWIELEGEPCLEPDERREGFVAIYRHPESPAPEA